MKFSRTLALLAFPAALSLAACGGGSTTGIGNSIGLQQQLRFVNGAPDVPSVDLFFTSSGNVASTTALVPSLTYGGITDFGVEPTTSAQVFIHPAGSATVLGSCAIPQSNNNDKISLVIVDSTTAGTLTCTEFKDFDYTTPGQYRVHHAAARASVANPTFSFGTTSGVAAATFVTAGTATFPGTFFTTPQLAAGSAGVNGPVSGSTPVGFAIGANAQTGTTIATMAQINANRFISPAIFPAVSSTQPDAANTLPGGGFNNGSIFAVDCSATTPQGTACVGGVALIGSFDTK